MTSTTANAPLVAVRQLCKSYGSHRVLWQVSLDVRPGEVVGLVGPNGAGKTTLLLTMMGFLRADSGEIQVAGEEVSCGKTPSRVGFVPDQPAFYSFLTARDHLILAARLMGKGVSSNDLESILRFAGLAGNESKYIGTYSRGMLQRLAWAQTLLTDSRVLLLDEPTSALDPAGTLLLRDFIDHAAHGGAAVLFSSHSLSEIERLCTRVLFLRDGGISSIQTSVADKALRFEIMLQAQNSAITGVLSSFAKDISVSGRRVQFSVEGALSVGEILKRLESCNGVRIVSIQEVSGSLEDAFFRKLGEQE